MEYYNIFEENERGSYTPGFFQMKLSFPFNTNYWCPLKLSSPIWLFIFLGQPIY